MDQSQADAPFVSPYIQRGRETLVSWEELVGEIDDSGPWTPSAGYLPRGGESAGKYLLMGARAPDAEDSTVEDEDEFISNFNGHLFIEDQPPVREPDQEKPKSGDDDGDAAALAQAPGRPKEFRLLGGSGSGSGILSQDSITSSDFFELKAPATGEEEQEEQKEGSRVPEGDPAGSAKKAKAPVVLTETERALMAAMDDVLSIYPAFSSDHEMTKRLRSFHTGSLLDLVRTGLLSSDAEALSILAQICALQNPSQCCICLKCTYLNTDHAKSKCSLCESPLDRNLAKYEHPSEDAPEILCAICCEPRPATDQVIMMACLHGNEYCAACVKRYIEQKIQSNMVNGSDFSCPRADCKHAIADQEVEGFSGELLRNLRSARNRLLANTVKCTMCNSRLSFYSHSINYRRYHRLCCSNESCGNFKEKILVCVWCRQKIAPFERTVGHICRIPEARQLQRAARSGSMKCCPSCFSPILKNGGCSHMHCESCNHHFCWRCLEPNSHPATNGVCKIAERDIILKTTKNAKSVALVTGKFVGLLTITPIMVGLSPVFGMGYLGALASDHVHEQKKTAKLKREDLLAKEFFQRRGLRLEYTQEIPPGFPKFGEFQLKLHDFFPYLEQPQPGTETPHVLEGHLSRSLLLSDSPGRSGTAAGTAAEPGAAPAPAASSDPAIASTSASQSASQILHEHSPSAEAQPGPRSTGADEQIRIDLVSLDPYSLNTRIMIPELTPSAQPENEEGSIRWLCLFGTHASIEPKEVLTLIVALYKICVVLAYRHLKQKQRHLFKSSGDRSRFPSLGSASGPLLSSRLSLRGGDRSSSVDVLDAEVEAIATDCVNTAIGKIFSSRRGLAIMTNRRVVIRQLRVLRPGLGYMQFENTVKKLLYSSRDMSNRQSNLRIEEQLKHERFISTSGFFDSSIW